MKTGVDPSILVRLACDVLIAHGHVVPPEPTCVSVKVTQACGSRSGLNLDATKGC
jgi:hypothetical protein